MSKEKPIDVEQLEKDERADRFSEALEGAETEGDEEASKAGFTPSFPASGVKGWGSS